MKNDYATLIINRINQSHRPKKIHFNSWRHCIDQIN